MLGRAEGVDLLLGIWHRPAFVAHQENRHTGYTRPTMPKRRRSRGKSLKTRDSSTMALGLSRQSHPVQAKIDAGDLVGAREALKGDLENVERKWFEGKIEEAEGDLVRARRLFTEGLEITKGTCDAGLQSYSARFRFKLGLLAWQSLDREAFEENLVELRRLEGIQGGLECLAGDSHVLQALMNELQWRNGAAATLHEQVRRIAISCGDQRRELSSLMFCARATRYTGEGHQRDAHTMLMLAVSLAAKLKLKFAELRTRMFLVDTDDASVDTEDVSGKERIARRYTTLRNEAEKYGFGALVMRFDERLMRRPTARLADWTRVVDASRSRGYERLALLRQGHSLRYASANEKFSAVGVLEDLVRRVRNLKRPEDGTLALRDAAQSIAHLADRGINLGVSEADVAQRLRDLREECAETASVHKLHLERQGALVRKLLEALTPESPRSKLELALGRGYAKLPTFDVLLDLQTKKQGDFVTISEIASVMSASQPGSRTLSESTVYKRVRRLAAALKERGSPFRIETRKGSGVRIVGPGVVTKPPVVTQAAGATTIVRARADIRLGETLH